MAKPSANLRLFVAAYPPPLIARGMLEALNQLQLPPHRASPLEQVHLTLQFIGDVPARELDDTIESVQRSGAGIPKFNLTPRRLISLPERGPARLIACETDAPPPLRELHTRLATRLARNVREKAGDRFRPHYTLCRFRSPARLPPVDLPLELEPFPLQRIVLMRSTLSSQGAQHHEVAACELA